MYTRILVPLDGSATARHALDHAAGLARLTGATLLLLHVIEELDHCSGFEPATVYVRDVEPKFLAAGQALLDEAAAALRQGCPQVETILAECKGESVAARIVEHAAAGRCDVIVMGTHGRRGLGRVLLGSDAEQVARTACAPVLLVRECHVAGGTPASGAAPQAR